MPPTNHTTLDKQCELCNMGVNFFSDIYTWVNHNNLYAYMKHVYSVSTQYIPYSEKVVKITIIPLPQLKQKKKQPVYDPVGFMCT